MRKGYGPTGVSFTYTVENFKDDLIDLMLDGKKLRVELVAGGNTYTTWIDPNMGANEAQTLYDAIDHVQIVDDLKIYQLQTGV